MTGFIVLGTDTDAGKTAFCAQFLCAFTAESAYWKPVETGPSDTETIRSLVPSATIFAPLAQFRTPVAPLLAAAHEGRSMPSVAQIQDAVPRSPLTLVVETFGSPLSPFNDESLQAEVIAALGLPAVVVTSSAVGAVGRTLQAIAGMSEYGLRAAAVVLLGPRDEFALSQIERHAKARVFAVALATDWTPGAVSKAAEANNTELHRLRAYLATPPRIPHTDLIRRDGAAIWHPYTSLAEAEPPLAVVGAHDEYLELSDGSRLIDGISSWWTILHAHRHPPLMKALRSASRDFDHILFAGATHPPGVELAERLLAEAPWRGGRVFFSDNGSTAVEVALKMAYQGWCHRGETGRELFIGFENGYHGDTFGAMAVARDPVFFSRFEPLLFRTLKVAVSADHLSAALTRHKGEVAGVILEPLVQAAGGMRMHTPAELHDLFAVTREHGVYFIADEVMTGCGRTGSLWAFQQADIAPDLICIAKTLAGGILPLAATLASPEVVAAFDTADRSRTFFHGHSFTGHPLACAVAVANWDELATGEWSRDVARIQTVWQERLTPLTERPGVKRVSTCGVIGAVEFAAPGGYLAEVGRQFRKVCRDHGVLLRPLGNVLYALPPFRTRDSSLHRIADAIIACANEFLPGRGGCENA
jgi:adenosylmethionine-8-amino-7-oxononanoate aminotransferase